MKLALGDLYAKTSAAIDPRKFPDEVFDLLSVPSHDRGVADRSKGSDIGSAKVPVEPGDVLICRIVPHIRRVWVVPQRGELRQIASGEWIVLRGDQFDPNYLRHLLLSDDFHAKFMATVAGVGGSLMRARPAHAASIPVALPPLPEQCRIASILDQVDVLRRALRESVELAASLEGSLLRLAIEEANGQLESVALAEVVAEGDRINYGVVQPGAPVSDGVALIRAGDLGDGRVDRSRLKFISPAIERAYARSRLRGNEILVSCVGSVGEVAIVSAQDVGSNIARAVARVPLRENVSRDYVFAILRSPSTQEYFKRELRTVAQPTLNIKQLTETPIDLPSHEVQARFAARIAALQHLSALHLTQLAAIDELFASLQNRAFTGAL